jgi:hypothetical protein
MAEMSKAEQQAIVNEKAPKLWFLEHHLAAKGDLLGLALVRDIHSVLPGLLESNGLTVPAGGTGGVVVYSGGGGKGGT